MTILNCKATTKHEKTAFLGKCLHHVYTIKIKTLQSIDNRHFIKCDLLPNEQVQR